MNETHVSGYGRPYLLFAAAAGATVAFVAMFLATHTPNAVTPGNLAWVVVGLGLVAAVTKWALPGESR